MVWHHLQEMQEDEQFNDKEHQLNNQELEDKHQEQWRIEELNEGHKQELVVEVEEWEEEVTNEKFIINTIINIYIHTNTRP